MGAQATGDRGVPASGLRGSILPVDFGHIVGRRRLVLPQTDDLGIRDPVFGNWKRKALT